jgi:asparagine synthase (glutamine-hydrolysing)
MCGLAGVVVWDERFRVTRETLSRMSAKIAHRGPDGEGVYLNHEQQVTPDHPQVGLVHRRLAIIDPDPHANQPFTDHAGRWIVFNGEIYNFHELRAQLEKLRPDYVWRTICDTEALLIAYDVWGEACLEKLNGMYAFAIWDEPKKELFLARDRMGQKPLYYACVKRSGEPWVTMDVEEFAPAEAGVPWKRSVQKFDIGAIAFASEITALRPVPWVDWSIDQTQISAYLAFGYTRAPRTVFSSIGAAPPAQYCCLNASEARTGHYFHPNLIVPFSRLSNGATVSRNPVDMCRELLIRAVKRQLIADVPLGCFLSGGVDSSVVTAAMRAVLPRDVRPLTFSIAFEDPRYDESAYAREIAARLRTEHHEFTVRPNAADDLPRLAAMLGEPFGDSSILPTHYLSRETRKHVKVALSGDGGDELFGGYDRYRALRTAHRLSRLPHHAVAAVAASASMLPGVHPKSKTTRIKRFFDSIDTRDLGTTYVNWMRIFSVDLAEELWPGHPRDLGAELTKPHQGFGIFNRKISGALALDRVTYLPGDLLTKADRASMFCALEVRSPYMDHELVQFAAGLTTDQLLKGGPKRMLREAFAADLPAWVFKRRKMGFAVPIGEWFRGELRSMLRDSLFASDSFAATHFNMSVVRRLVDEHEQEHVDHSQRLYALLMLELWWNQPD